jgi:Gas vesicle protein G
MLLLDDILLSPITGFLWIVKEINNAAQQELDSERDAVTAELGYLYMMLEAGQISDDEFDAREQVLLDRLDKLQGQSSES